MVISVEGKLKMKKMRKRIPIISIYLLFISLYFFSGWNLKGAEIYNKQE
jgi:hypothetical protein